MTPYKVIVVDDSAFMRKIISDLIEKDTSFQVVDTAVNGREAVDKIIKLKPDIVTMDVEMPELNGLEALKAIMAEHPLPVIMLSGINEEGMKETIIALESGAFDFIRKPSVSHSQHIDQVGKILLEQLRAAMSAKERRAAWQAEEEKRKQETTSFVQQQSSLIINKLNKESISLARPSSKKPDKLLGTSSRLSTDSLSYKKPDNSGMMKSNPSKRDTKVSEEIQTAIPKNVNLDKAPKSLRGKESSESQKSLKTASSIQPASIKLGKRNSFDHVKNESFSDLIAVGCSTGGPRALKTLLEQLPADFPAPVVIVQHMPPKFTHSLAQRLNTFSPLEVLEAEHGMLLQRGKVYIAPGGYHMHVLNRTGNQYSISLSDEDQYNGHKPSVDVMFKSLLTITDIKLHLVLMTGMGSDGADMMKRLYDKGVTSTFAESEETCVVYGMPRSAVELKCVNHVLPLYDIAGKLVQAVK
ncbi:protein-glutamate methylesterase/protein-glutamine glutaminase [Paenibacillus pini]|uniref:Protein-glutamate methylesterase/protein-glutamine glutaminase n=1 Tax=Paenibacillus pini JCM 16418 TaxID=1236976 RepID=W7YMN0_9BACL|nr:chemotaxis response regulator protein-glutamate methylesterase [Paenibacillus pini]GAF09707.1 chemotaxis response regulator protein-glutamate methylesterase CheB [Paenibacillus pini JCM 16418]